MTLSEIVRAVKATHFAYEQSFGTKNKLRYEFTLDAAVKSITDDPVLQELVKIILCSRGGVAWIDQNLYSMENGK